MACVGLQDQRLTLLALPLIVTLSKLKSYISAKDEVVDVARRTANTARRSVIKEIPVCVATQSVVNNTQPPTNSCGITIG